MSTGPLQEPQVLQLLSHLSSPFQHSFFKHLKVTMNPQEAVDMHTGRCCVSVCLFLPAMVPPVLSGNSIRHIDVGPLHECLLGFHCFSMLPSVFLILFCLTVGVHLCVLCYCQHTECSPQGSLVPLTATPILPMPPLHP